MKKEENVLTPTQILEMRKKLVAEYGEKIIIEDSSKLETAEEKVASVAYQTLSEELHKLAPDTANLDKTYELFVKNEVNSLYGLIYKYIKKAFWFILAILVLLAVIKFLFL